MASNDIALPLEGLHCGSCVRRTETAIAGVDGVASATVNLASMKADVALAPRADRAAVLAGIDAAVAKAGFAVAARPIALSIEGMHCASCVGRVERALAVVPGVRSAAVNLATQRATVQAAGFVDAAALADAVAKTGYKAKPIGTDDVPRPRDETTPLRRDLIIAAALTLPVFLLAMGGHLIPALERIADAPAGRLVAFVLTTLVLFGPGLRFFRHGLPALVRIAPDMNSLVVLGATAAWGYSTVATFAPRLLPTGADHVYFEAAAVIVTLILLGRWLEARAKGRAGAAIERLVGLRAKTARVVRDGTASDVPLDDVRVGDLVQVRPGETIPVDGIVEEGSSRVDESMLTRRARAGAQGAGRRRHRRHAQHDGRLQLPRREGGG